MAEKWAMYLRKSRADLELEKVGQGETLKKHREILTDLAKRRSIMIGNVYEELVSGETIANRPEMQKMISDCYASKYVGIVCIDVDRLSRGNQGDMQTIMDCLRYGNKNRGLLVMTPSKTYDVSHNADDEEYMEFVLFMSRREYKTITKRMQRGKLQSVVEGNYVSAHAPYGWDIVRERHSRTLKPNEDAKWVKMMYEMAADGNTYGQIASKLNALNVPTLQGADYWMLQTVKHIVENPINKGYVSWNKRKRVKVMVNGELVVKTKDATNTDDYMLYQGKHMKDIFIDPELWEKANNRTKHANTRSEYKLRNKLAGLLKCKECGRAMNIRMPEKDGKRAIAYRHPYGGNCKCHACKADKVINGLVEALEANIENFEMMVETGSIAKDTSAEKEQLEKEIKRIERSLDKLFEGWESDLITPIQTPMQTNSSILLTRMSGQRPLIHSSTYPLPSGLNLLKYALPLPMNTACSPSIGNLFSRSILSPLQYAGAKLLVVISTAMKAF